MIQVMGGKAYCVVHKQALFTIDINGQMDEQVRMSNKSGQIYNLDEQDTGKLPKPSRSGNPNYSGPPIHTLTIFANPVIDDEPDIFGEGVLAIQPGEEVAIAHSYISTVELYISEIWFGNIDTHKMIIAIGLNWKYIDDHHQKPFFEQLTFKGAD